MKKTITILSIFALLASGCNQSATNQVVADTETISTIIENVDFVEVQDENEEQILETPEIVLIDSLETAFFRMIRIDSATFFASKEEVSPQRIEFEAITDLEQIKEILDDRAIWNTSFSEPLISKVILHDGDTFASGWGLLSVDAYFPQLDILLTRAHFYFNVALNLTTGATTEVVGNPFLYVFSPSKRFLFNQIHSIEGGLIFFIQEKIDGQYQTIIPLSLNLWIRARLRFEQISNAFWENDTILNIATIMYHAGDYEKLYYRIILWQPK